MIKEFFGIGGFTREVEGYFSWQHLTFVTVLMVIMTTLAVLLGKRYRNAAVLKKNRVIVVAAISIVSVELTKIIFNCWIDKSFESIRSDLPLFLCSIQLITIPLAAFSKGRIKQAALDFVFIFGLLGAVLGTYAAGNNYGSYPVISFVNVNSGITHAISGFCSLFIAISGMASMKKKNMWITFTTMFSFAIVAYIVNKINYPNHQNNYMFLSRGDGTPYDILYNLVGGNEILYPVSVVALFVIYIFAFYTIFNLITYKKEKRVQEKEPIIV